MNTRQKSLFPVLALTLFAGAGCVTYRETKTVDVPQVSVAFASDKAARTFYEAFTAARPVVKQTEKHSTTWFGLTSWDSGTVPGPNAAFNEAVRVCDTNGDRLISEGEAEVFARNWTGRTAKT